MISGEATNLTNEGSLEAIESQNISNTSYLMWFWESLPTIFSIEDSIENSGSEDRKIFELGMFVDEIKLAFKTQEILNDSIVPAAKKVFYKSLLEISLQEVYSNLITCGSRKMNVSFGISYVEARAIDDCCCGSKLQQTVRKIF